MADDAPSEYQHIAAKCRKCDDRFTVVLQLEPGTPAEGIDVDCPHCGGENAIQARAGIRAKVTVGKGWTPRAGRAPEDGAPRADDALHAEAEAALSALRADLEQAMKGENPSREAARDIARRYRKLHDGAVRSGRDEIAKRIDYAATDARQLMALIFGSGGWEEAVPAAETTPARRVADDPGDAALEPLTDKQLGDLEDHFDDWPDREPLDGRTALQVRRALAELRRLRSARARPR